MTLDEYLSTSPSTIDALVRIGTLRQIKHPTLSIAIYSVPPDKLAEPGVNEVIKRLCTGIVADSAAPYNIYGIGQVRPKVLVDVNTTGYSLLKARHQQKLMHITEKFDGEMGVTWSYNDGWTTFRGVATPDGGFDSPTALWATDRYKKQRAFVSNYSLDDFALHGTVEVITPEQKGHLKYPFSGLILTHLYTQTGVHGICCHSKKLREIASAIGFYRAPVLYNLPIDAIFKNNNPNMQGYILTNLGDHSPAYIYQTKTFLERKPLTSNQLSFNIPEREATSPDANPLTATGELHNDAIPQRLDPRWQAVRPRGERSVPYGSRRPTRS